MKSYTITVNGNVYDVTVEENGAVSAPAAAPRRAAAPAPEAPSPSPATRCGTTRRKPLGLSASPGPRMRSTSIFTPKRRQRLT